MALRKEQRCSTFISQARRKYNQIQSI